MILDLQYCAKVLGLLLFLTINGLFYVYMH